MTSKSKTSKTFASACEDLERFFQKSAARNQEDGRRGRGGVLGRGRVLGEANDESSLDSVDNSRASSVTDDLSTLAVSGASSEVGGGTTTRRAWAEQTSNKNSADEDEESTPATNEEAPRKKRRGRKVIGNKVAGAPRKQATIIRLTKGTGLNKRTPSSSDDAATPSSESPTPPPDSAGRPMRAAVATANAISEAQMDMAGKGRGSGPKVSIVAKKAGLSGGTNGRKRRNAQIASRIAGLDLLHQTTMDSIDTSNKDVSAPTGCVNERLNRDHPRSLVHEELPTSLNTGDDGKPIPFQLQVHLEKVKHQYLSFIKHMQDPAFRDRIESDIAAEKRKNTELARREKQLISQIDNLISDSLGLLKCRLSELGITAKSPPEFIEKAKGIVCHHHDLQKNKVTIEAEVRNLEVEQEKMIRAKEREMVDALIKRAPGMTVTEARKRVKATIENTINALQGADNKVSPLLNKLADVTLTKCAGSSTLIRKRPKDYPVRDWPEKRSSTTPSEAVNVAKIDNNEAKKPARPPAPTPPRTVEVEVRRVDEKAVVELPRVDINMSSAVSAAETLVLPPHPESHSRSSEAEEAPTYSSNKMSSTPRAEQFEDRLKTVVHSVLAGDADKADARGPADNSKALTTPNSAIDMAPNNKPMFSPVKKELPAHLPPPPSGVMDPYAKSGKMRPQPNPSYMQGGTSRVGSMNELIEREIERSLLASGNRDNRDFRMGPMSPQKLVRHNSCPIQPSSTMSRMSQVIEDSIRGHVAASSTGEARPGLEGLACPRTKSPSSMLMPMPMSSSLISSLTSSASENPGVRPGSSRSQPPPSSHGGRLNGSDEPHEYPAMEGLCARFSSYLEKRRPPSNEQPRPYSHSPPSKPGWTQPPPLPPPSGPSQHGHHDPVPPIPPNTAYRFHQPTHHYQQQPHPSSTSSTASAAYNSVPPRKRSSPSAASAHVLPPKGRHMDNVADYRYHHQQQQQQQHHMKEYREAVAAASNSRYPAGYGPYPSVQNGPNQRTNISSTSSTTLPQMNIPQFGPDDMADAYSARYPPYPAANTYGQDRRH